MEEGIKLTRSSECLEYRSQNVQEGAFRKQLQLELFSGYNELLSLAVDSVKTVPIYKVGSGQVTLRH